MKPFKVVKEKLIERKLSKEEEEARREFLEKWKKQFEIDKKKKEEWDRRFEEWEGYYNGRRVFDNLSENVIPGSSADKKPRTVINFPRMVVEALIDLNVPEPDFQAVSPEDEQAVKELRDYVAYVVRSADPSLEEINLENERRVKKYGGSFIKVHWNNRVRSAGYVGAIEISNPHPKHIIVNAGATGINDMEHYHHVVNRSTKYILRRWPHLTEEMLEQKAALYVEYDELVDEQRIPVFSHAHDIPKDSKLNKYTIIETTYRDEDGDICKLWWSGDLLIEYIPKFFYRRDEEGNIIEYETLEAGTQVRAGIDENGNPIYRTLESDEQVEYYIPKCFDIIYQPFIPRDLCFWGISIMEDIKDPFESILKAFYIQEESFLKGRKKIVTDNDEDKQKLENPTSEVVTLRGNVREIDLGTNIDGIAWIEKLKEWIQLMTGSTNAVLGVHDAGVKSGKQAQLYVEQGNYKVAIASAYKAVAFRKLYRIIAEFALAFCDDDRPFRLSGQKNEKIYGVFNHLNMLRDINGQIVLPDWDVIISTTQGWMKSKAQIFDNIVMLANNRAFEPTKGNLIFLKILQKLGVPHLDEVVAEMEKELSKAEEMAQQQVLGGSGDKNSIEQVIRQLPPEQQQVFMSLPPEQQQALLQEAMTSQ